VDDEFERTLEKALLKHERRLKPEILRILRGIASRAIGLRHRGAFTEAAEIANFPESEERRHALSIIGSVGLKALTQVPLKDAISIASGITAMVNLVERRSSEAKAKYQITEAFAEHYASRPYTDEDPLAGYANPNVAELAVVQSNQALRHALQTGDTAGLDLAHAKLNMALSYHDFEDGRALALSRIMIDNSFLGDGKRSLQSLLQVNFDQLSSRKVVTRLLDFGSSVALNSINPKDFLGLSSPALKHLESGWSRIGDCPGEVDEYAELYDEFGIGVFTIAQQNCIRDIAGKANSTTNHAQGRERWFNLLRDIAVSLANVADNAALGTDFLYSLHRPTFHASASGDHAQTRKFLDYYFGRVESRAIEGHIDSARASILRDRTGSSPWMFLLDVATQPDPDIAFDLFHKFLGGGYTPAGRALKRATVEVGYNLGLHREALEERLKADRTLMDLPETSIHMVYINEVGMRWT
jgi:hypothetical protein